MFSIYQNYGGFENDIVCDLGCGTGMLMIGALRIGAE
jgi:predicted RNA methylase